MNKKAVVTADEVLSSLRQQMNSFIADPPDSDYQKGYLSALLDTKKFITGQNNT